VVRKNKTEDQIMDIAMESGAIDVNINSVDNSNRQAKIYCKYDTFLLYIIV